MPLTRVLPKYWPIYGGEDQPVPSYTIDHQAACDDETAGRWTGDGTLAWKPDHFFRSTTATPQAVSVSKDTDYSGLLYTPAASIPCTGKYLIIRIYQYHSDLAGDFGDYLVYLLSEPDFSKSSDYFVAYDPPNWENACDTGPGWRTFIIPVDSIGIGTLDDFTAITQVRIRCKGDAGQATEFAVHQLDVASAAVGSYAIRIDAASDNFVSIITAYAASKGVKLTIGVVAALLSESSPSYAGARGFADYGHEIVVYGGRPGAPVWAAWTAAEKLAYVSLARRQMEKARLAWNGVLFVPGGMGIGGPWDRENLIRPGLLSCISGAHYASGNNYLTLPGFRSASWTGFIAGADGNVPAWLAGAIVDCENNGGLLVLGGHVEIANDRASLMRAIDALAASTLVNKTFGENVGL